MRYSLLLVLLPCVALGASCHCADADITDAVQTLVDTCKKIGGADCDFCSTCTHTCPSASECQACFPGTARVVLEDNSTVAMRELQAGDKVQVAPGQYSEVYYFSTKLTEEEVDASFVQLQTTDRTLLLSDGHYLYLNGELAPAKTARPGDELRLADGSLAPIQTISYQRAKGLYNPHTLHGDIVVDGITTSTYTEAVNPSLAHALLLPLRTLYLAGLDFGAGFDALAKGVPPTIRALLA